MESWSSRVFLQVRAATGCRLPAHAFVHTNPAGRRKGVCANARLLQLPLLPFLEEYTVLFLHSPPLARSPHTASHFSSLPHFCAFPPDPVTASFLIYTSLPAPQPACLPSPVSLPCFLPWDLILRLPKRQTPLYSPPPASIPWVFASSSSTRDSSSPRNNGPHLRAPL